MTLYAVKLGDLYYSIPSRDVYVNELKDASLMTLDSAKIVKNTEREAGAEVRIVQVDLQEKEL